MAGRGTRLRPHTNTVPKPLVPIAVKPIVQHLVEDLAASCKEKIEEIAFIIGDFGKEVEEELLQLAESLGAKGHIFYQKEQLGTAHAIMCAAPCLDGPVIVAFADTLFKDQFSIDPSKEGIIWVKKVEDPRAYGVVKLSESGFISDFIEKPTVFVSDQAIIGIYYFKEASDLRNEIQYLLDHNIKEKGEFQLTNALENLKNKGQKFYPHEIEEWLDCGNKNAVLYALERILHIKPQLAKRGENLKLVNSQIIEPCYIGDNVSLEHCIVGPHVSIGDNSVLQNVIVQNSIIGPKSEIKGMILDNSMLGSHVKAYSDPSVLSWGDYTEQKL
jgi:glucose-1-phosphate thymidylyltransferase